MPVGPDSRRIRILLPVAPPPEGTSSVTFQLGRPLNGVRVGLRLDEAWRSYFTVVDVWEELLVHDGAQPVRLVTADRVGPMAERTRLDLDEWSRLVDCGVIGLGN